MCGVQSDLRRASGDATPRRYQEASEDSTTDYFWIFPLDAELLSRQCFVKYCPAIGRGAVAGDLRMVLPEQAWAVAAKAAVEFSDEIQIEDIAICETVQREPTFPQLPARTLSVKQEQGVHALHRMYAEIMQRGKS